MPNYKNVNEGIVDRIVTSIIHKFAAGLSSATINRLKQSDPALAKEMDKIDKARDNMEAILSKKKRLARVRSGDAVGFSDEYLRSLGIEPRRPGR